MLFETKYLEENGRNNSARRLKWFDVFDFIKELQLHWFFDN